jgi:Flp pilus assembly protein TadG
LTTHTFRTANGNAPLPEGRLARLRSSRGQSIVEFAICLPLLLLITLGVVETSQALMSQHVITKMAREGSNMISRETRMQDAGTALQNMSANPGEFNSNTYVIFSVLLRSPTGTNAGQLVLYQRYSVGNSSLGSSRLNGNCGCTAANDYTAQNPNSDAALRVTNAPPNIASVAGGLIYVTEIYTRYDASTPLGNLTDYGIPVPTVLYSVAYF